MATEYKLVALRSDRSGTELSFYFDMTVGKSPRFSRIPMSERDLVYLNHQIANALMMLERDRSDR